jgi:hypothetical protein
MAGPRTAGGSENHAEKRAVNAFIRIEEDMEIEQTLPKKPNFLLILGLFCVTILVIFALALTFLEVDKGHLGLRHHSAHPTSQLVMPAAHLESEA